MPSSLGGNPLRVSASDAALLANASSAPLVGLLSGGGGSAAMLPRPRPVRGRNPITGDPAREVPPPSMSASHGTGMTLHNGRPFMLPSRGTIASMGSNGDFSESLMSTSSLAQSPAGRAKAERLQYDIWCEAQQRKAAERELRQVRIHGRARPPWIGDARSSGYRDLMPQTR